MTYLYNNYIDILSKRLIANLTSIETEHNFEFGTEFEIVLCETLRSILPDKIGVTRGFVVSADGSKAGDDIVLFERSSFPTLALREHNNYARKEFVPIEATYCYIEAKHTVNLRGEDRQSLLYASRQVGKVKSLLLTRAKEPLRHPKPENYPDYANPPLVVVK